MFKYFSSNCIQYSPKCTLYFYLPHFYFCNFIDVIITPHCGQNQFQGGFWFQATNFCFYNLFCPECIFAPETFFLDYSAFLRLAKYTMCDFLQFWSHFYGTMHCLPQTLKISNNVDFSLWGNRATTQNTFFDIFKWDQNHENHT